MIDVGDVLQVFARGIDSSSIKRAIIIAQDNDDYLGVFINSNAYGAALGRIELSYLHPKFEKNTGRTYLDSDSYIDCYQPCEYSKVELLDSFNNNKENFIGTANKNDINLIKGLIKQSPVIVSRTLKKYQI
jgi:hypothetical protein